MATTTNTRSNVGAYHYSANKELFEIQRGNNFEFVIDKNLDGINAFGSQTKTFQNAQELIRLSVASVSAPHVNQNVIEVRRGNTGVKYAGTMSYGSGTLSVYDFIGAETADILMAWKAQAGNPLTQQVGLQADYKRTATLIEYSPDYEEITRTWVLEGCWISSISEGDFSVDEGGSARRLNATLEYDRAYVTYEA